MLAGAPWIFERENRIPPGPPADLVRGRRRVRRVRAPDRAAVLPTAAGSALGVCPQEYGDGGIAALRSVLKMGRE
jgi:hypothetical protein